MLLNNDTDRLSPMEYAFLVQTRTLPHTAPGESGGKQGEFIGKTLMECCAPLENSLGSLDSGGWRVLSNDVMQSNGTLIVSFLICRDRREQHHS
jgi:hypothetical protein